jgi:hypothetical protein
VGVGIGTFGFGDYLGFYDLAAYFGASLAASTVFGFYAGFEDSAFSAGLAALGDPAGLEASGSTSKSGLPTPRLSPLLT